MLSEVEKPHYPALLKLSAGGRDDAARRLTVRRNEVSSFAVPAANKGGRISSLR
jgi:hypothetical protein